MEKATAAMIVECRGTKRGVEGFGQLMMQAGNDASIVRNPRSVGVVDAHGRGRRRLKRHPEI